MPIFRTTIDYYTCKFKCGHKKDTKFRIENHEKICFCNPENKACRMCNHCQTSIETTECTKLNLWIENKEQNPKPVYDIKNNTVWESKNINWDTSPEDQIKIEINNQNRPFPRINCEHFILGKKRY